LVPSDFHLFSQLKREHFDGKRFTDDAEVETEVWKWLKRELKDLYAAGFDASLLKQ
jgi:hypothetical protein